MNSIVIMGVAGCGKSSLGAAVAQALGRPLIEGDEFHPPENVASMRAGTALTDADRAGWLDALAHQLRSQADGVVLTCSALKQAYRDRLRAADPGLRFVHLRLDRELARQRVERRAGGHYFGGNLVDSQFDTLESPLGEPRRARGRRRRTDRYAEEPGCRLEQGAGMTSPVRTGGAGERAIRLIENLMAACLAVMALAVFVNVVLRYGFGTGVAASEELSRLLFVWMVFIGAAAAYPRGEHMTFTALLAALRDRPARAAGADGADPPAGDRRLRGAGGRRLAAGHRRPGQPLGGARLSDGAAAAAGAAVFQRDRRDGAASN